MPEMPGRTLRIHKETFSSDFTRDSHHHNGTDIIYVISGKGTNTMNGVTRNLRQDDVVVVPRGVDHSVQSTKHSTITVLSIQIVDKGETYLPKTARPNICRD